MQVLKSIIALGAVLSLGACASVQSDNLASIQPSVPQGPEVAAPQGFAAMCEIRLDLCGEAPPAPMPADDVRLSTAFEGQTVFPFALPQIELAGLDTETTTVDAPADRPATTVLASAPGSVDDRMAMLRDINRVVNRSVRQTDDPASVGDPDLWRPAVLSAYGLAGDCKNIAVEKFQRLVAAGYPSRDLYYAQVYRRDIGLHAVLVARLDTGDYVLDSRSPYIVPWSEAPYQWVKRQAENNPARWVMAMASVSPPTQLLALNTSRRPQTQRTDYIAALR